MKRYLVIGYTAKGGGKEFTSVRGYALKEGEPIPPHPTIRKDCLDWANREGDNFNFFCIDFMTFVEEKDYASFMQ